MKTKKNIVWLSSSLLLTILLFSIAGCNLSSDDKQAPSFSLKLLDGTEFSLRDYEGTPLLINFWATWCPACRQEVPALKASYEKYKNDIQFIAIAVPSDKENDVRAFVANNNVSYPVGIDTTGKISNSYRVRSIPATFFITRDGMILDSHVGAMNESQFSKEIEELLK